MKLCPYLKFLTHIIFYEIYMCSVTTNSLFIFISVLVPLWDCRLFIIFLMGIFFWTIMDCATVNILVHGVDGFQE